MKYLLIAALALFSAMSSAATLNWTLPTTRANDTPLSASEIGSIKVYKSGTSEPIATLSSNVTSYIVPDCVSATYTATVTDTGGLESDPSNTAAVTPLRVTCAPKAPTGLVVGP